MTALPDVAYDWPVITGKELRDARRRAGYRTQAELAEALGVSIRTITNWETSQVAPGEEDNVRRLLWPAPAPLSAYHYWELLSDLGRRLAQAEAAGYNVNPDTPGNETVTGQIRADDPESSTVTEAKLTGDPPSDHIILGRGGANHDSE